MRSIPRGAQREKRMSVPFPQFPIALLFTESPQREIRPILSAYSLDLRRRMHPTQIEYAAPDTIVAKPIKAAASSTWTTLDTVRRIKPIATKNARNFNTAIMIPT